MNFKMHSENSSSSVVMEINILTIDGMWAVLGSKSDYLMIKPYPAMSTSIMCPFFANIFLRSYKEFWISTEADDVQLGICHVYSRFHAAATVVNGKWTQTILAIVCILWENLALHWEQMESEVFSECIDYTPVSGDFLCGFDGG